MKSSYQEAYDRWYEDRTPENMSGVLDSLMPTINSEIMRYEGDKAHLRSRAKAIAVNAVKTFNPERGAKLQSWVTTNLRQLSRYGHQLRDVKASELAIRQAAEINRVSKILEDDLGREPTITELADEIGISPKKIARVRSQVKTSVNSGSFSVGETEATPTDPGVYTPSTVPFAAEATYMSLSPTDRFIFDSRTGMHGAKMLSNKDIAAKLGVSEPSISQRVDSIGKTLIQVANS